jgi:hypothetical protein
MKQRLIALLNRIINRTSIRRHINYGRYVIRHKRFVYREGRKLGLPRLMLLAHDWDKLLPDEWFSYSRTFYKADGSKQYDESDAFKTAWAKHQWRNKHHWQNWMRIAGYPIRKLSMMMMDRGVLYVNVDGRWVESRPHYIELLPMPELYRLEMIADWRGAGMANGFSDTAGWYIKNRDLMKLNTETRQWIEDHLDIPAEQRAPSAKLAAQRAFDPVLALYATLRDNALFDRRRGE